jgi:hypothetical protein
MGEILTIIAIDVYGSAEGLGDASTMVAAPLLQTTIQNLQGLAAHTRAASAFSSSR